MAKVERALIVGAGIGGLAAYTSLAQVGIAADVIERTEDVDVYGVGIVQPANSLRVLKRLGVLEEILDTGWAFEDWLFYDHKGNLVVEVPSRLGQGEDGVPAEVGLMRPELHRVLIEAAQAEGARVRYGTTIADLQPEGERVAVQFSDGSSGDYDLVIAFDGIKSEMRRRLFGDGHEPLYTGAAVWRVGAPRLPEVTCGGLYQSPIRKAGRTPLGEDKMYLLLVTEEPAGVRYAKEDLVELMRERLEEFEGTIGEIRDGMNGESEVVYSPLSEVLLPTPWHRGRVVLGGDAAHACVPHLNQGAAMAIEDAATLAEELAAGDTVEAALASYSARRYPRVQFAQKASRDVLDAERLINPGNFEQSLEALAAHLPQAAGEVDEVFNQAA
jgi:2-polyprenyl-6-methoxyphenol hydroxylase-like FAD-dependent oxidoreductase